MLVRANIKLAKAVAKLPIKRASARRVSAAMKSRVIASITNEQRASKVNHTTSYTIKLIVFSIDVQIRDFNDFNHEILQHIYIYIY